MTGAQAIIAAAKFFDKNNEMGGDARSIYLEEFTGDFGDIQIARARVNWSDHGDYIESDRNPYVVMVKVNEFGKIETWRAE